jgi:hypothetical protein
MPWRYAMHRMLLFGVQTGNEAPMMDVAFATLDPMHVVMLHQLSWLLAHGCCFG